MTSHENKPYDTLKFDAETNTYHAHYAHETTKPSRVIIATVARIEGRDEIDIPPLGRAVDVEALDALVGSGRVGSPSSPVTVTLTYCGYRITIDSDGTIVVRSSAEPAA
jgi:hypothetical protein